MPGNLAHGSIPILAKDFSNTSLFIIRLRISNVVIIIQLFTLPISGTRTTGSYALFVFFSTKSLLHSEHTIAMELNY